MRLLRRSGVGLAVIVIALMSCQTSSHEGQSQGGDVENTDRSASLSELPMSHPFGTASCPSVSRACTEQYDPVQCFSKKYKGRNFLPGRVPVAWGENSCIGFQNLNQLICQRKLVPTDLSGIECVPDSSNGACHRVRPNCPKDENIYVCFAETYNHQNLKNNQILRSWGYGECEAKEELSIHVCQVNLNPKLMGKISCRQDQVTHECIKTIGECFDKIVPTRCQGVLKNIDQPVEATSDSECAAKAILRMQSCMLGHAPSGLQDVVCRSL